MEIWSRENPTKRDHLNEWLMDLALDPLHRSQPDPNIEGLFFARVPGTEIGVWYAVDLPDRKIYVGIIGDVS